jgi:hypothetical protein
MGFPGLMTGLSGLKKNLEDLPAAMDKQFTQVVKDTGVSSKQINTAMTYMLDPLYAARKD